MSSESTRLAIGTFPSPIIVQPVKQPHDKTIIFLHGRGFNAQKFHGPLLQSNLGTCTFREALPHVRFVFPTAPLSRATKYRRTLMHQWYDGSGDWEPEARGGMRPSVAYIHGLIRTEMELVGRNAKRIVLAGFSQGCATALMSGLLWDGEPLGALLGLCGFMPLASHLLGILDSETVTIVDDDSARDWDDDPFDRGECGPRTAHQKVLDELLEEAELPRYSRLSGFQFRSIPVFLGHGSADTEVGIQHASQAATFLKNLGLDVDFRAYEGLGHWYFAGMLIDAVQFLSTHVEIQSDLSDLNLDTLPSAYSRIDNLTSRCQ